MCYKIIAYNIYVNSSVIKSSFIIKVIGVLQRIIFPPSTWFVTTNRYNIIIYVNKLY